MVLSVGFTVLWVAAIYAVERKGLKNSNKATRWLSISLLLASGLLWELLLMSIHLPRPSHWLTALLEPLVPVP